MFALPLDGMAAQGLVAQWCHRVLCCCMETPRVPIPGAGGALVLPGSSSSAQ